MNKVTKIASLVIGVVIVFWVAAEAYAQSSGTVMAPDWAERHSPNAGMQAHGSSLLGDSINTLSGRLSFETVDVSLPGNSKLPVELRRRLNPSQMQSGDFADWQLAIPTISTKILMDEWYSGNRWGKTRCTSTLQSAIPSASWPTHYGGSAIPPNKYSDGVILDVPGRTTTQILDKTVSAGWPASADKVTVDGWYLECISNIDGTGTEGFVAVAPNGDRYTFDKIINPWYRKSEFDIWQILPWSPYGPPPIYFAEIGVYYDMLGVSKVTDVNGNEVDYTYDGNGRLMSIESNDGRHIDIDRGQYNYIQSVTANTDCAATAAHVAGNSPTPCERTWSYTYGSKSVSSYKPPSSVNGNPGTQWESWGTLTAVTLPDNRQWQYDLANLQVRPVPGTSYNGYQCKQFNKTVTVTHPDGVTGTFTLEEFSLRLGVGGTGTTGPYCPNTTMGQGAAQISDVIAVTSKTLSGPGMTTAVWSYDYYDTGSSGEIITTVVRPDNAKVVIYHPTPFDYATPRSNARVSKEELYPTATASIPTQVRTYTYLQESDAGSNFVLNAMLDTYRPLHNLETTLTLGSDWYKTHYAYNTTRSSSTYSYGFPTQIKKWSSLGSGTRISDITYLKDSDDWILGLKDTVVKNGTPFDDYGYDTKGRVTSHKRFGVTVSTYGYYTSGTQAGKVNWYKDALGRQTTFANYKRGIPGTVTRNDGTTQDRTIDDNGWITSITNWRGYTTNYDFDASGRLAGIDRPSPWTDSTVAYDYSSGNPIQTMTHGSERITTTYDAMLRPILERQQALSGGGGSIYTSFDYDAMGRTIFESLPSTSPSPSSGFATSYDEMGRVTQSQETASGGGTTTYDYLSGNKTTITDPLNNVTTTTSSGYGSPGDGKVTKIEEPEGIKFDLDYDIYGKVTAIMQDKGDGTTHDSYYYYDSRMLPCRQSVSETGDTLYEYNNANELVYYAEGQPSDSGCGTPPTATRIALTYTSIGRLKKTNYPSTTPDITRTYDANGNLKTINRGGVNWSYTYNSVDLLEKETLTIDGRTYVVDPSYTNDERLNQRKFPSGNTYNFNPDGFGRPKRIRYGGVNFASGISYYPNGKIQSLLRGNGGSFDQQLNARQLTSFIGSTYGDDFTYSYDLSGRINTIDAASNNAYDRSFTYDGVGRLETASGPWGTGSYEYDLLNNITRKTLGSRVVDIQYDSANHINRVRDTGVSSSWRYYGHDGRGNVTSDGIHGFTYDYADQPTVISGSDNGSYVYDGNWQRVKQVVNGETIYSIYSLSGELLTRDNITSGKETDYLAVAGQTFVRFTNGVATYPLNDHLGTALMVADQSGNISPLQTYNYTPFGEAYGSYSPGSDNEQGFTGHVEDATGLTYMQARNYDPVIGRFLQADPFGFADQFNLYAYVQNDPVNNVDPDGMATCNTSSDQFTVYSCNPAQFVGARYDNLVPSRSFPVENYRTRGPELGHYEESSLIGFDGSSALGYAGGFALPGGRVHFPSVYDIFEPSEVDAIIDSFKYAYEEGYYTCLFDCILGDQFGGVMGEALREGIFEGVSHTKAPERSVGAWYRYIKGDRRFTRLGKFSKVLVPRAAKSIRSVIHRAGVVGMLVLYYEIYHCTETCLDCTK